jgi:hypothetical protein
MLFIGQKCATDNIKRENWRGMEASQNGYIWFPKIVKFINAPF